MFLKSHFIGGDNITFAGEAYPERGVYSVTIENNTSKVKTVMTVFAENEQEARDNVALNGWTVIDVERLNEKEAERFIMSLDSLDNHTPEQVEIESVMTDNQHHDTELNKNIDGTEDISGYPPIKKTDNEIYDVADNLNILPTSPELEFIAEYNFDLGVVEPIRNPVNNGKISSLDKNGKYVVFGHADNVPVSDNANYGSNFELSYKRGLFIKDIMVRAGITADNIRVVGLGSNYPIVRNTKTGNQANRRVGVYKFKR